MKFIPLNEGGELNIYNNDYNKNYTFICILATALGYHVYGNKRLIYTLNVCVRNAVLFLLLHGYMLWLLVELQPFFAFLFLTN